MNNHNNNNNKKNLIIGFTGSVATIKYNQLIEQLLPYFNIKVILTNNALHFCKDIKQDSTYSVHTDSDEWSSWSKRDDPVLHIELRKWADSMLIAPLSANTLAKIANGMADNLLTSVVRAWDYKTKELILAPAMNTMMWENPFTEQHLNTMKSISVRVNIIPPISKLLICGDTGIGAMEEVSKIVEITKNIHLKQHIHYD
ncbi:phosphopantothenoylcysteine decarboxylase [Heterostelium album PN500]|uniref:Phosphopantothenoylcysteine decarboxylase n=1 Tax=Heterostelium pallidum (strain ATCC 26659 / Pp 5 / PN500) TaxID=670386 RepID=D3AYN0_HETP5|nr:phosphopantothenoylcysteine decarboxylase [Heterostelium album PN500]EFA86057.1 phosphopantothenoylcysteine decarboxylase [Heterostelium album PN500]|eukprot:XP_020438163.1 phosphopantothenoylcysteine decarboxylase [Heterostelium album PN500]